MIRTYLARLVFLPLALLVACGPPNIVIKTKAPGPYPSVIPSGGMLAGMGTTDLTGPPGYPLNGYAISGKIAHGVWIHPHATALYIRDSSGVPFVFVTCDLFAISDGLKQRVTQILSEDPATAFLGESDILLAATHNHHSLGVNVPDPAYTLASIGFGLDGQAFEFTAHRVAVAVKKAVHDAKPSVITSLREKVEGVAQNRSVNAYLRNSPIERQTWAPGVQLSGIAGHPDAKELAAMVRDTMNAFVVHDLKGNLTGVLATFPVHPSAGGDRTEVYSADVFGLAADYARISLATKDTPIVAFFNGPEGDVAPTYINHDRADVVRIAKVLDSALLVLVRSGKGETLTGPITHRYTITDISSREVPYDTLDADCYCTLQSPTVPTDSKAVYGAPMFGGASDGRTFLLGYGVGEGLHEDTWSATQGYKLSAPKFVFSNILGEVIKPPLQKILTSLVSASADPVIPISIHRIGSTYFLGCPGEFTTMLGRRIRTAVAKILGVPQLNVINVGLCDAYESYITTACEYNAQAYEGASDLFGISEGQVFTKDFEELASCTPLAMSKRAGRKKDYGIAPDVRYGPHQLGALQTWDAEQGLANLMVSESGAPLKTHYLATRFDKRDTVDLVPQDMAVAFSFQDSVPTWDKNYDSSYYPSVWLNDQDGRLIAMPEMILTVDDYSKTVSTWTIRIPDTRTFAGKTISIEASLKVTGTAGGSALFRCVAKPPAPH